MNQVELSGAANTQVSDEYNQYLDQPKLEVHNLCKSYGTKNKQLTILQNINLQIHKGKMNKLIMRSY